MKRLTGSLAALAIAATGLGTAAPAQAQASDATSLVTVLTSDGNRFDKNSKDFDIVTEAALAIVEANPDSAVAALADADARLTAFVPTDQAFRKLAKDLTGKSIRSEKKVFTTLVEAAGVDTIEQVLLYHVVPGATLRSGKVLASDGAALKTAQGAKVKVKVAGGKTPKITLVDRDKDAPDATVVLSAIDLNKPNKQIAHGIDRVLRPIDL